MRSAVFTLISVTALGVRQSDSFGEVALVASLAFEEGRFFAEPE